MAQDELLRRIDERLDAVRLSDRKACMLAGIGVDFIRDIRRRGHSPKADKLAALAAVLKVPPAYLLEAAVEAGAPRGKLPMQQVFVRGAVQAGVWRDAIEWQADDWYSITVPSHPRFPDAERFALEVRGPSMNLVYPEGTVVICVRYADLGRDPKPGERVICLRRTVDGNYEATVKEYQIDADGRHMLWPRSTEPAYQQPLVLAPGSLLIGNYEHMPDIVHAGDLPHDGGEPDLLVSAMVIQSVRQEG